MAAPTYTLLIELGNLDTDDLTSKVKMAGLGSNDVTTSGTTAGIVGGDLKIKLTDANADGDGEIVVEVFYREISLPTV